MHQSTPTQPAKMTKVTPGPREQPNEKPEGSRMTRVVHARLPEALRPACEALSRQVRDLHNTSVYLARVALSCFEWDMAAKTSVLKAEKDGPEDGTAVLAGFNRAVLAQNAKRTGQHKEKAKLLPLLGTDNKKPASTILDMTLFESTLRSWADGRDPQGRAAYARLPSWFANYCVQKARGSFSVWLAQRKAFSGKRDWAGRTERGFRTCRATFPKGSFRLSA